MNSIPETSPSPWPITRVGIKVTVWGVLTGVAVRGCYEAFKHYEISAALAVLMIVATLALAVVSISYVCRWIVGLDELQQKMRLQSLAWVGPGILVAVQASELLRWAGIHDGFTWNVRSLGIAFLVSYGLAYAWLWWRSR